VGKTTTCEVLAQSTGLKHISINQIVKDRGCHDGWNEEFQSWIVDEDKVFRGNGLVLESVRLIFIKLLDSIEDEVKQGGCIIDWHACDLFPRSWIDLVVVLRVETSVLYDRLMTRNYPEAKLQENLDSEIMEVLLQEAKDSYDAEIVIELQSNTSDEMDSNIERIEVWLKQWRIDNAEAEAS